MSLCKWCGIKIPAGDVFCSSECAEDCEWLKKRNKDRETSISRTCNGCLWSPAGYDPIICSPCTEKPKEKEEG